MTLVIAFLLGSMFGACVGFLTAGVLRAINDEAAPAADRRYLRDRCGEGGPSRWRRAAGTTDRRAPLIGNYSSFARPCQVDGPPR